MLVCGSGCGPHCGLPCRSLVRSSVHAFPPWRSPLKGEVPHFFRGQNGPPVNLAVDLQRRAFNRPGLPPALVAQGLARPPTTPLSRGPGRAVLPSGGALPPSAALWALASGRRLRRPPRFAGLQSPALPGLQVVRRPMGATPTPPARSCGPFGHVFAPQTPLSRRLGPPRRTLPKPGWPA